MTDIQGDWKYCNKCSGLFYSKSGGAKCPAGGEHTQSPSGNYFLIHNP